MQTPLPPTETAKDPAQLFNWIEENIFADPNGKAGYFGDWRMEWAEAYGYLKVKQLSKVDAGHKISPKLYNYDIEFNFVGIKSMVYVMTYAESLDNGYYYKSNVYGAIHRILENTFAKEEK